MFGFLKKKLKEAADKITNVISKEEKIEKVKEESVKEEISKEQPSEQIEDAKKILDLVEPVSDKEVEIPEESSVDEAPVHHDVVEPTEEVEENVRDEVVEQPEIIESKVVEVEEPEPEIHEITESEKIIEPVVPALDIPEPIKPTEDVPEVVESEKLVEPDVPEVVESEKPIVSDTDTEPSLTTIEDRPEVSVSEQPIIEKPKKKGFLEKIKSAVTEKKISEKEVVPILEEMKISLIQSDVALDVAEEICEDLKNSLINQSVKRGQIENIIHDSLKNSITRILDQEDIDIFKLMEEKKPLKVVFIGFNGTGKTTTIARLGSLIKSKGKKPIFAAADTFRAAAIHQLEEHGQKLGIDVIKHDYGADPAAVIFDAVKAGQARGADIVLADTAGRSQANSNLMDELKKIVRVNSPDLKILVVDCLTGNDAVDQAQLFNDAVGVDGIIMTKADVYEKGGAVLSAAHTINKPILYIGTGQDYKDLKKFDVNEIIDNLLS